MTPLLAASLLVAATAFSPIPVRSQTTLPLIKVGVIPIENSSEAYYADEIGFFKKAGLNVQIETLNNGGAIAAAVAAGALDVGFSNLVSIATAYTKGIPFTIIAPAAMYVSTASTTAMFVSKDSPYTTARSLNGKTIAVNGLKNIAEISTRAWLDAHGGDSSTIKFIEMPESDMAPALRQKRIEAAMGSISADATLNTPAAQERILGNVFEAIAPRFLITGYITTSDWVAKHPDAARKFAQAIANSAQWANTAANNDASAAIVSKRLGIPIELMKGLTRSTYAETMDPAQIQPLLDTMARYKFIPQSFPAKDIVSPVTMRH